MYDIIIIGGGVAGCYLAHKLPANLNILLIEKDKKVFLKDSGIVSSSIVNYIPEKKFIKNDIYEMKAVSPSGKTIKLQSFKPFAHILKREEFSHYLRHLSKKKVEIVFETVIKIENLQTFHIIKTNRGEYRCKFIVGADGACSIVRRSLNIKSPHLYCGIFVRTKQNMPEGTITVFLNKYFSPDFFSWIIPQNNEYGLLSSYRPREYFAYFKKTMNLNSGELYSSLLPLGYTRSYAKRALLIGDACGQSKPITGGGIIFSLKCATYAANTIKSAFEENRFDEQFLSLYEFLWKRNLAGEINKQLFARRLYRKMSNKDIDKFFMEIGPYISRAEEFDYDSLSSITKKIPKWRMLKYLMLNISLGFR